MSWEMRKVGQLVDLKVAWRVATMAAETVAMMAVERAVNLVFLSVE